MARVKVYSDKWRPVLSSYVTRDAKTILYYKNVGAESMINIQFMNNTHHKCVNIIPR